MLYYSAVILALFLTVVLITKRHKSAADYLLAIWLAATGLQLLCFYLFLNRLTAINASLVTLGFSFPLLHGPLLYLYTRLHTSPQGLRAPDLLHLLPFAASLALFSSFHFLSGAEKLAIYALKGQPYHTEITINNISIYISGILYIGLSLVRLLRYRGVLRHQFSSTSKINFNWLLYLIIWMGVIWTTVLFVQESRFVFASAALFVIWIGYFGIRQVNVFSNRVVAETLYTEPVNLLPEEPAVISDQEEEPAAPPAKYQKSSLNEDDISRIHQELTRVMQEEHPYRNPELTLNELAGKIAVHPNHLSQVINTREQKNFYDYINFHRVQALLILLQDPKNKQFTLLHLAFECGFNSKASFNRNFKKVTGYTPSEYMRRHPAA